MTGTMVYQNSTIYQNSTLKIGDLIHVIIYPYLRIINEKDPGLCLLIAHTREKNVFSNDDRIFHFWSIDLGQIFSVSSYRVLCELVSKGSD